MIYSENQGPYNLAYGVDVFCRCLLGLWYSGKLLLVRNCVSIFFIGFVGVLSCRDLQSCLLKEFYISGWFFPGGCVL